VKAKAIEVWGCGRSAIGSVEYAECPFMADVRGDICCWLKRTIQCPDDSMPPDCPLMTNPFVVAVARRVAPHVGAEGDFTLVTGMRLRCIDEEGFLHWRKGEVVSIHATKEPGFWTIYTLERGNYSPVPGSLLRIHFEPADVVKP
jgi:hypothetical protein